MADKRKYRFIEQEESKGGMFATKLSLVSLALFVLDIFLSFLYEGKAGAFTGAIACSAFLLAIYAFYVGMNSFKEKDVSPTYSIIGSITAGVAMIVWLTIFLNGLR